MTLERQGVPTATYVTHVFHEYARGLCRMQGLMALPLIVIQHPVSARPVEELREKVKNSYGRLRDAITNE